MKSIPTNPDIFQARYWESPLSRLEAQKVFDEYTVAIRALEAQMNALNLAMAFIMFKTGSTQVEFQAFVQTKMDELKAQEAASATPADAPAETTPAVTLN